MCDLVTTWFGTIVDVGLLLLIGGAICGVILVNAALLAIMARLNDFSDEDDEARFVRERRHAVSSGGGE